MAQTGIKRILIFDDDPDFRKLLTTRLGKQFEGIELEEYDPVARGVPGESFDWSRYDVLLLDYYLCLHGTTGLDILQANRKNLYFPATIMLTGAGNEEVAVRALKAGVHDYLRKEKLDKNKLREVIIEAYEQKKAEKEKIAEQTRQGRGFNKALFYQELEQQHGDRKGPGRVLLLINLDNNKLIEKQAGPVLRDSIVRHIARQGYDIFQLGNCNPYVTRFSDTSVALIIDNPGSDKTLAFNLQGLCSHIKKRPYKYEAQKFRFSISIGAVRLDDQFDGVEALIEAARTACAQAAVQDGNSYHIFQAAPKQSGTAEDSTVQASAGEESPAVPEKPASAQRETADPGTESEIAATDAQPSKPTEDTTAPEPEPAEPVKPGKDEETTPAAAVSEPTEDTQPSPERRPDDIDLIESKLGEQAQRIKQAFDEQRITQTFQSIISLSGGETDETGSVYYVSLRMLNKDGTIVGPSEIIPATDTPSFRKHIDRWMLREIMGRIINSNGSNLFLVHLSRDSLADASLFTWLRDLLSGFGQTHPGHSIALEIDAADFAELQKPAGALMAYLSKNHGFSFVLSQIDTGGDPVSLCSRGRFDFLKVDYRSLAGPENPAANRAEPDNTWIAAAKAHGIQVIADNIEDSMSLTAAIGLGVDLAMGPFIGDSTEQIDEDTNIESFEIV